MSKIITPENFPLKAFEHNFFEAIDLSEIDSLDHCMSNFHPGIWFIITRGSRKGFKHQWLYEHKGDRDADFDRLTQIKVS